MPRNKYNIALIISYSNSYQPRGSLGNEIALLVHLNAEHVSAIWTIAKIAAQNINGDDFIDFIHLVAFKLGAWKKSTIA